MKKKLLNVDPVRVLALLIPLMPILALLGLGLLWLWQSGYLLYWLIAMVFCGALGYGAQQWLVRRERQLLTGVITEPNPEWPPSADAVWQRIEAFSQTCSPEDWPLEEGDWVLALGQKTMDIVAHCYHPEEEQPLLELTIPHTLLIIERASRDLRKDVAEKIPFSNRLTIGDFFRLQRWKEKAEQAFAIYRAGSALINPVNALLSEAWRHLRMRSFDQAKSELHRWFLRAYVQKVGFYAIDLYSGRLSLDDETPTTMTTPTSEADLIRAKAVQADSEPLRIVVLGRMNAGKSSLINALFGEEMAITDVLPDQKSGLIPFSLSREGLTHALIFDTPGCDASTFDQQTLIATTADADLILWVSPVTRPDRQIERQCLDALRAFQTSCTDRHPAPLLVIASFIDQLRPINDWHPPYDLTDASNSKAANINAAVRALAADLAVPIERVIPVCLQQGKVYNVNDTLWAVILSYQDEAQRVRLMRCLDAKKRNEDWVLLRRHMAGAGRFLRELPEILAKHTGK